MDPDEYNKRGRLAKILGLGPSAVRFADRGNERGSRERIVSLAPHPGARTSPEPGP